MNVWRHTVAGSCSHRHAGTTGFCCRRLRPVALAGWIAAIIVSSTCLAARSLHTESARVASALLSGDIPLARRYLSCIVGRDTDRLEEPKSGAQSWKRLQKIPPMASLHRYSG